MFPVATIATACLAAPVMEPNSKLSCGSFGSYIDWVVTAIRNADWFPRARLNRPSTSLMTTRFLICSLFGFHQLVLAVGTSVISVRYLGLSQRFTTGTDFASSRRARLSSGTKWIAATRDAFVVN